MVARRSHRVTRQQFLAALKRELEWDGEFSPATTLAGSDRWDSVAVLSAMTFIDQELGLIVSSDDLLRATFVSDVLALVEDRLE